MNLLLILLHKQSKVSRHHLLGLNYMTGELLMEFYISITMPTFPSMLIKISFNFIMTIPLWGIQVASKLSNFSNAIIGGHPCRLTFAITLLAAHYVNK